ncbi:hypothetical protein FXO38_23840 [Capsicum annuum]|nr:hypothetical protein FXO38_23840 [Capsicum annuum]KAF3640068.1 hypothetical protein FXO37_23690 [Capsicum annuum]
MTGNAVQNGLFTSIIRMIYVVGSLSSNGLYLLDFYPDCSSPCHVDFNEEMQELYGVKSQHKQNQFVPTTEGVTACIAHPSSGTILVGTEDNEEPKQPPNPADEGQLAVDSNPPTFLQFLVNLPVVF